MPGFFDALADFKPTLPKKHYLTFGEKITFKENLLKAIKND